MIEKWALIILIGAALCVTGFIKGCSYGQQEHEIYLAKQEAASQELIARVLQRNALLKAKYDADAKAKDADYAKTIATIRARSNAAAGVKLFDPGKSDRDCPATGKNGAGSVESAAAPRELSSALTGFLVAEATRADEVAAYATTCYAWVNFGERK